MPVPRQRLSQRRGRTRASHHSLKAIVTVVCPNCKKPAMPHLACRACGYYNGRNVNERSVKSTVRKAKAAKAVPATTPATETKPEDTKSTK
ncbi:MAG: hypothetical protein ACD_43C00031G0001 [uncultured bacterium]|nr:MAG: hypothetical protein ACD_43C00031G0001 [uncultured bacterium]